MGLAVVLAALVLGAVLVYFFLRARKKSQGPETALPPAPAHEQALSRISHLEERRRAKTISVRDFAAELSSAVRSYLEAALGFPALERTPLEVKADLELKLRKALPVIPRDRREELDNCAGRMLRLCERAAFADQAEASYALESEELQRGLEQGRFVVKTLHEYLQKEEERRRSVVEHAPKDDTEAQTHAL
jgi:hypothetical protein